MPRTSRTIHIIEPGLHDQAGHCYSFVRSIASAAGATGANVVVWARRDAQPLFEGTDACTVNRHFRRLPRRLQAALLVRSLLIRGESVFLTTATITDLVVLALAAPRSSARQEKCFAFLHWYRSSPLRMARLRWIARRLPGISIICPTASIAQACQEAGFAHVHVVGYPHEPAGIPAASPNSPERILYAGAARIDKGFSTIVDLAERLAELQYDLPLHVQCSPTHRGRHEPRVASEIDRLRRSGYAHLVLMHETMDERAYRQMFSGAITLQPYDAQDFADRVSGVSLDALAAGSPIIVPHGTWMARLAERFEAGLAVGDARSVHQLLEAINRIRADWPRFAAHVSAAALQLAAEHDAARLVGLVLGDAPPAVRSATKTDATSEPHVTMSP